MIKSKDDISGYKGIDLKKIDFNINTENFTIDNTNNILDMANAFVRKEVIVC